MCINVLAIPYDVAALCYVELGALVQQSGGEYAYLKTGYGEKVGNVLAFLYAWACLTIIKVSYLICPFINLEIVWEQIALQIQ